MFIILNRTKIKTNNTNRTIKPIRIVSYIDPTICALMMKKPANYFLKTPPFVGNLVTKLLSHIVIIDNIKPYPSPLGCF